MLHFGPTEFGLQGLDGNLAGGQGQRGDDVLSPRRGVGRARPRQASRLPRRPSYCPGEASLAGRLTLDAALEGAGRSAVALIGSLEWQRQLQAGERERGPPGSRGIQCDHSRGRPGPANRCRQGKGADGACAGGWRPRHPACRWHDQGELRTGAIEPNLGAGTRRGPCGEAEVSIWRKAPLMPACR